MQSIWGFLNSRIQQRLLPPTPIDMMDEYYKKISMIELILVAYGNNLVATKTNNISYLYSNNYRYSFSRDQTNKYTSDWQETDHQEGDR